MESPPPPYVEIEDEKHTTNIKVKKRNWFKRQWERTDREKAYSIQYRKFNKLVSQCFDKYQICLQKIESMRQNDRLALPPETSEEYLSWFNTYNHDIYIEGKKWRKENDDIHQQHQFYLRIIVMRYGER